MAFPAPKLDSFSKAHLPRDRVAPPGPLGKFTASATRARPQRRSAEVKACTQEHVNGCPSMPGWLRATAAAAVVAGSYVGSYPALAYQLWNGAPAPQVIHHRTTATPEQQQCTVPAPPLVSHQQQQQQPPALNGPQPLGEVAAAGHKFPWILTLLGVGLANVLGLRLVLQALRSWKDSSAPCTLVTLQLGLRLSSPDLQQRLTRLGDMAALGQQGTWAILEETVLEVLGHQQALAYGWAATEDTSVARGYERFKEVAGRYAAAAARQEELGVVKGVVPEPAQHRSPLGRLMGAPPTEEVEERQQVLLLTLVVAVRSRLALPPIQDWPSTRHALNQLCGLSASQLMALELLWTPTHPADFLSEAALMEDAPHLVELRTGRTIGDLTGAAPATPSTSTSSGGIRSSLLGGGQGMQQQQQQQGGADGGASSGGGSPPLQAV